MLCWGQLILPAIYMHIKSNLKTMNIFGDLLYRCTIRIQVHRRFCSIFFRFVSSIMHGAPTSAAYILQIHSM